MTGNEGAFDTTSEVYEDRLLIFLDILGFRKLIDTTVNDPTKTADILHLLTHIDSALGRFRSDTTSCTLFSDTICLSYHRPANFASTLYGLSLVIVSLLGQGYATRGAVVRGPLYHRGNIIFGPSLVRAYELESRLAIFPRIILDPKLPADLFDAQDQRLQPVYEDYDGLRCVNFLSPVMLHVVFRLLGMSPDSLISDLSDKIERLVGTGPDEAALQKTKWLQDYARRMLGAPKPDEALVQDLVDEARRASTQEVT